MPDTPEEDPVAKEKALLDSQTSKLRQGLIQRKGVITRYINKLARLGAEKSYDELEDVRKKLKWSFDEFDDMYNEFCLLIAEADAVINDEWFNSVQDNYVGAITKADDILLSLKNSQPVTEIKTPSYPNSQPLQSSKPTSQTDISLLNLPRVEIEPFDGNPLRYHSFMNAFRVNVDAVCKDANAKLVRLMQYTRGIAHEAIRGTQIKGGEANYQKALDILKSNFGSKHVVTQEIIRSMTSRKSVKTPEEVRALAFELRNSLIVLTDLDALNEVNVQVILKDIIQRLPSFAQMNWDKKQLKCKREQKRYLLFTELVDFVDELNDELNDPLCGHAAKSERSKQKSFLVSGQSVDVNSDSVNTAASKSRKSDRVDVNSESVNTADAKSRKPDRDPCTLCTKGHFLSRCRQFQAMPVNDRLAFVRQKGLCFNCLREGHSAARCSSGNSCFVCKEKHSVFLHSDASTSKTTNAAAQQIIEPESFVPIVKVTVNGKVTAKAALDTCSSSTFCSESLAQALNLKGKQHSVSLGTIAGESLLKSKLVSMTVSGCQETMKLSGVKVVQEIPVSMPADIDAVLHLPHLKGIDLSAYHDCTNVDLLIGQDFAEALFPFQTKQGKKREPYAVKYKFGWALSGNLSRSSATPSVFCHFISSISDPVSSEPCERMSESFSFDDEIGMSWEDRQVIALWDREVRKEGGHYELPIPWRNPEEALPNNFALAKGRLDSLVKRLSKEGLYERYNREIERLLDSGYAEVVPTDQLHRSDRIFYLPHHNVHNPNKPEKLRVVFDCACKYEGKSLNDRCMQGPNLLNNLFEVLLRFRSGHFAVQADIQAMYNQVRIPVYDRDALRFLWYQNKRLVHLRMTSHLFGGVWCQSSSVYALRRTVKDFPNPPPLVEKAVLHCMYVDDCLMSVDERDEVDTLIHSLPEVLLSGGFLITKFVVNDESFVQEIPAEHRAKEIHLFSPDSESRVLGVIWNIHQDVFRYTVKAVVEESVVTRRYMLKAVASFFDPLGLSMPWVITGKILLQRATKLKLSWDDEVPADIVSDWFRWLHTLVSLRDHSFPRCVVPVGGYLEYHVFCDASFSAYGACVYVRHVSIQGQVTINLVAAKGHVTPIKTPTIPRMELQAAVVAVKLAEIVRKALGQTMTPVFYWTDSMIVLGYITNNTRRFRLFVSNRVSIIRSLSDSSDWRHVSGKDNPADLITRPQTTSAQLNAWHCGPDWLLSHNAFWTHAGVRVELREDDPEVIPCKVTVNVTTASDLDWINRLIAHYSEWVALYRSVAWLLRFASHLKTKQKGALTAAEIDQAQHVLIRRVQRDAFAREIDALSRGKALSVSSKIRAFSPYLDSEGLMRVGGRTGQHPILLPCDHAVTIAICRYYHCIAHSGAEWCISLVREKFWILKCRRIFRQIIKNCVTCKRLFGKPAQQVMADLPPERVTSDLPPFSVVGIDAFGPFEVSHGRSSAKRYGCIFTCFATRAVHIETLASLDASSFINAFSRFIARRGLPRKVVSDNGRNFVRAEKELKAAFLQQTRGKLRSMACSKGIEWVFNPPVAPHMGGVWERMIGVIKRVLRGILNKASIPRLTDEILSTVFCEAEFVVNSRPLTKLSEDPSDPNPLTPNHLLILREGDFLPNVGCVSDAYRKRWRFVQHIASQFWKRFVKEYLPELNKRSKWTDLKSNLRVGELVIIAERGMPRGVWPLGRVVKVFPGRDGFVRSAIIKTRASEFCRPITQVIRLELDVEA